MVNYSKILYNKGIRSTRKNFTISEFSSLQHELTSLDGNHDEGEIINTTTRMRGGDQRLSFYLPHCRAFCRVQDHSQT